MSQNGKPVQKGQNDKPVQRDSSTVNLQQTLICGLQKNKACNAAL